MIPLKHSLHTTEINMSPRLKTKEMAICRSDTLGTRWASRGWKEFVPHLHCLHMMDSWVLFKFDISFVFFSGKVILWLSPLMTIFSKCPVTSLPEERAERRRAVRKKKGSSWCFPNTSIIVLFTDLGFVSFLSHYHLVPFTFLQCYCCTLTCH